MQKGGFIMNDLNIICTKIKIGTNCDRCNILNGIYAKYLFYKCSKLNNFETYQNQDCLKAILDAYQINANWPKVDMETRENYFIHRDFNQLMLDYNRIKPYISDEGILTKISSKSSEGKRQKCIIYEKDLCKELWWFSRKNVNFPFDIIDLEIPLKSRLDQNFGEIDLIGLRIENGRIKVLLLEVKRDDCTEALLRATTEIISYFHLINKEILKKNVMDYLKNYYTDNLITSFSQEAKRVISNLRVQDIDIVPAVLVPIKMYNREPLVFQNYKKDMEFYAISYSKNDVSYTSMALRSSKMVFDFPPTITRVVML